MEGYFEEMKEFILCKKSRLFSSDQTIERSFRYDFTSVHNFGYKVDPRYLTPARDAQPLIFFHDDAQKDQIHNAKNLYGNHPDGIGRMIQRVNLKHFYRKFVSAEGELQTVVAVD